MLASLDPLAAMAGTDDEKLRALLADVSVDSEALAAMLAELAPPETKAGLTDPDDIPAPPDEATTKPGDLWLLGDHRLLCGDAGSVADLDRLLDGAQVSLLATDPPYNVKVEPRSNNAIAAGLSLVPPVHDPPPGARPRAASREGAGDAPQAARQGPPAHERLRVRRGVRGAAGGLVRQRRPGHEARRRASTSGAATPTSPTTRPP